MATGDVYRIALEWTLNGLTKALTTFGLVEGAGAGGPNPMADVADHVAATLGADPITGWSQQTDLTAILVSDVQPGTRGGYRLPLTAIEGDVIGDSLPPQDAMVVSLSTGLKGKANNGRMYLPGFPESVQTSGFWQSDGINPASAFVSLLFDEYVSDGTQYQWHLISYVPASSPRELRAVVPITAFTIDNVVRSMRSRQNGRGQ